MIYKKPIEKEEFEEVQDGSVIYKKPKEKNKENISKEPIDLQKADGPISPLSERTLAASREIPKSENSEKSSLGTPLLSSEGGGSTPASSTDHTPSAAPKTRQKKGFSKYFAIISSQFLSFVHRTVNWMLSFFKGKKP